MSEGKIGDSERTPSSGGVGEPAAAPIPGKPELTYYELLRVHHAAPADLISAAYWKLIGEEQDKRHSDAEAEAHIHQLTRAYQELSRPSSRAQYNARLGIADETQPRFFAMRRSPFRFFGGNRARDQQDQPLDYYEVLRVLPGASQSIVQEAYTIIRPHYLRAVLDGVQPPELLELIDESHAILSVPQERARYDANRRALAEEAAQTHAAPLNIGPSSGDIEASRHVSRGGMSMPHAPVGRSDALAPPVQEGRAFPAAALAAVREMAASVAAQPWLYALTALGLVAVLAVAAGLRMWQLGSIGLRGDEAVYAGQAAVIAGDDVLDRYFILVSRGSSNFLLFQYILAAYYAVFGVSDVGARTVSALLSVLTVGVTFELGRTLYGRSVALLGAFLLAISSYSVALGRLALLDSTMTLFFVMALLFVVKWQRTQNPAWLYAFAGATALAMEAKVVAVLVIPVALIYMLSTGQLTRLDRRTVLIACGTFVLFMAPALLQLATNADRISDFLSQSGGRASKVSWYYYASILTRHEGYLLPLVWAAGAAVVGVRAVTRRSPEDLFCLAWIAVVGGFFQLYPLKAFNYMLPLIPVFCLVGARALLSIPFQRMGYARVVILAVALFGSSFAPLKSAITDDSYVGLREASYWLEQNTPPDAGVMTLSRGSAQYVVSFYGQRDAYPFGRFRLATVIPGGAVIDPAPVTAGKKPNEWVTYWPEKLIADKTVSYLVFYTDVGDDPPDDPIVQTATQRQFRELIETYDGRLLHTVYHNHEPRVWIYQVKKILEDPQISFVLEGNQFKISGEGFHIGSQVTLTYHKVVLGAVPTDQDGRFSVSLPQPQQFQPSYYLTALDQTGNYASSTLLRSGQ